MAGTELKQANDIVTEVDRDNVGLVLDTFHFYTGHSSLADIEQVHPDKLFIFHINDAEDLPKEKLQDANRLFPGLGVIPLANIIGQLRHIGYERMVRHRVVSPRVLGDGANGGWKKGERAHARCFTANASSIEKRRKKSR